MGTLRLWFQDQLQRKPMNPLAKPIPTPQALLQAFQVTSSAEIEAYFNAILLALLESFLMASVTSFALKN
jgi:hypothetical protein